MVFSSIFFIFCFLPVFLLLYYLIPQKGRNVILVAGSIVFYAWGEPVYVILMLFSCIFHYYMGLEMESCAGDPPRAKRDLIYTVVVDLFILGFFKYYGPLLHLLQSLTGISLSIPDLALPIGISFYTFKNMSYVFDVRSGKVQAARNPLTFAVYSTMFPHMAAGPIVRYADIEEQLQTRTVSIQRLGIGAEYFIKGLSKKVLLADNLAPLYADISASGSMTVLSAWIGIGAYTLQIYLDFSGYSDMAIGLGKMLGFDFAKNFDYPYTSASVTEFWRRWHISLGSWFRDYIYIPLGGNRVSRPLHIRNILVVWALTGLWHGASWNFVFWGLYYGLLLLLEKYALKNILPRIGPLAHLYTMLAVVLGWVFFSQTSPAAMGGFLGALVGIGASGIADRTAFYYIRTYLILFIISVICCAPGPYRYYKRIVCTKPRTAIAVDLLLLLLCIAYMVYNSYTPFLYLQF